jgi:hypothetical protein
MAAYSVSLQASDFYNNTATQAGGTCVCIRAVHLIYQQEWVAVVL